MNIRKTIINDNLENIKSSFYGSTPCSTTGKDACEYQAVEVLSWGFQIRCRTPLKRRVLSGNRCVRLGWFNIRYFAFEDVGCAVPASHVERAFHMCDSDHVSNLLYAPPPKAL
jgi:hypothetical protein